MFNRRVCRNKSAQLTTEVIIVLAIAFFVFLIFLMIILPKEQEIESKRTKNKATELANLISSSINQVYISGNGAQKTIYIPQTVNGIADYNITISGVIVDINYKKSHVQSSIMTSRITGEFELGYNLITNSFGEIIISS
ncbi:MAG TPA: hypothetical protein PLX15_03450 [Candidatus Woesearchaeota archaeon]|nr:hypothetical protein [Candidatus Woesearchaeota archaeon]